MKKVYTRQFIALAIVMSVFPVWHSKTGTGMQLNANGIPVKEDKREIFYVIDASYIDHSGDYADCVQYADTYKDHHNYIVVSSKNVVGDTPE